jgi:hypothetical protein
MWLMRRTAFAQTCAAAGRPSNAFGIELQPCEICDRLEEPQARMRAANFFANSQGCGRSRRRLRQKEMGP